MSRLLTIAALLLILTSCTDRWYLKKAIEKNPKAFADTTTTQTVDTVIIEVQRVETKLQFKTDTLIKYIDTTAGQPVEIRYKYSTITDSIYLSADCPDTEVIERIVTKQLPPVIIEPSVWDRIEYMVYLAAIILMAYILFTQLTTKK